MTRWKIDPKLPDPVLVRKAAERLSRGEVVAYPTETFYGLGASPFDRAAYQKVLEVKGREAGKDLPLIVGEIKQIELLAESIPPSLAKLAARFWPGPLTLVIPIRSGLPGALENRDTVAVRVSGLKLARELSLVAGFPLTSTSANPSRLPPAQTADEVEARLGKRVDLILDGGRTEGGLPSTIVDLRGPEPKLVRRGAVDFQEVLAGLALADSRGDALD